MVALSQFLDQLRAEPSCFIEGPPHIPELFAIVNASILCLEKSSTLFAPDRPILLPARASSDPCSCNRELNCKSLICFVYR